MDPLNIVASSFSIAGAIAKASVAIFEFSYEAKDAAEDLNRVHSELQALSSILDPLARCLSASSPDTSDKLAQQLQGSLEGCSLVVAQIADLTERFRRDGAWTRAKWVRIGRGDMEKLRDSLEAYRMALSLGLHAVSMSIQEDIKKDTGALRSNNQAIQQEVAEIRVNTDGILARVNSIRNGRTSHGATLVERWAEEIAVLTLYADSSYQGTVADPSEAPPASEREVQSMLSTQDVSESDLDIGDGVVAVSSENTPASRPHGEREENDLDGGDGVAAVSSENTPASRSHGEGKESGEVMSGAIEDPSPPGSTEQVLREPVDKTSLPKPTLIVKSLDLVVGIDIGELSTAVSWMAKDTAVHGIREWPGGTGPRVPTTVCPHGPGSLPSWGFQCIGRELFQRLSLAEFLQLGVASGSAPKHFGEMRDAWVYFLSSLRRHIRESVSKELGTDRQAWAEMAVEFHFSLPDMIRLSPPWALARLKRIIRHAGFGTEAQHCAILGLTETEAVATTVLGEDASSGLDTLVVKVGEGNVSILESSWKALLYSRSQTPPGVVVLPCTTEAKEIFTRHIQPRLRKNVRVAIVGTGPTTGPCADALRSTLKSNSPFAWRAPCVLPDSGGYGAAVEGLFTRRQAWKSTERRLPFFQDANIPCMFIQLSDPSNILDTSRLVYTMTNTVVRFEVPTVREQPPAPAPLQFDISYLATERVQGWVSAKPATARGLTRLCTVRSSVDANSFEALGVKDKWYKSSRTIHVVRFSLHLFAMEPSRVGPQFQVFVRKCGSKGGEVQREAEVTWHAEPPHVVWPSGVVAGRRRSHRQAPEPAGAGTSRHQTPPQPPPRKVLQENRTGQGGGPVEQEQTAANGVLPANVL